MPSSGGFEDSELAETLRAFPFAGVDSELSDDERFARGVAQVFRAFFASGSEGVGSHSAFLLHPGVPVSLAHLQSEVCYALDDGQTDVTNGVWFVGPSVIQGSRLEVADTFDAMFPQVVDAGLGALAAVTFRRTVGGPVLSYYPAGLGAPERKVRMRLTDTTVTLAQILELVDIVHQSTLVAPTGHQGGAKLWKNRAKHHPVQHVEVEIQAYLRTGLSTALPLCRINPEQNLVAGRLDLEIEELDPSTNTLARHAILELKVLRSFGSTGLPCSAAENEKWVSDGVDQAYAYREERKASSSALCCFDMRVNSGDSACLRKVESKASSLDVILRSWPLYPDAKQYRTATATAALSAGSPLTPA